MSDIIFSKKYKPLFNLLLAWKYRGTEKDVECYYTELSKVHTVLISGGRDSGKTFSLGHWNTIAVADFLHSILYTRYTLSSVDNSIEKAQENRIEELKLTNEFNITSKSFAHAKGGKIDISGQKTSSGNQTAKMKSLEGYSVFITEEAEELVSYEEWEKITRSIRVNDKQSLSILVFNPPTKAHWIYEQFYQDVPSGFNGIKDGVMYIHTTYLDNGKENMTITNWEKYEKKRLIYEQVEATPKEEREVLDPKLIREWKDYKSTILGGFKDVAEGVIYEDWEIGDFDESLPDIYGLDFGSNDPDALTRVAVDIGAKRIYLEEVYFKNNTSFDGLKRVLEKNVGFIKRIVADSAERRMINDLYDEGFNIEKCRKGKDSVSHGIKLIQGYTLVVTKNSLNLQKALNNYRWHDKKSDIPNHDWSDLCDSFRYAVIDVIADTSSSIVW
jgi:phage terminase large subunit